MKALTFLFFVLAFSIYVIQRMDADLPLWIDDYVNDFICLPLVLGFITLLFRWIKNDIFFIFPPAVTIFMTGYYSYYFEYYLPKNNPRYTADPIDIVLYIAGGLLFYWFSLENKKAQELKQAN